MCILTITIPHPKNKAIFNYTNCSPSTQPFSCTYNIQPYQLFTINKKKKSFHQQWIPLHLSIVHHKQKIVFINSGCIYICQSFTINKTLVYIHSGMSSTIFNNWMLMEVASLQQHIFGREIIDGPQHFHKQYY